MVHLGKYEKVLLNINQILRALITNMNIRVQKYLS